MPSDFPTPEQEREMIRDAEIVADDYPVTTARYLCCHVKALLSTIAELRAENARLRTERDEADQTIAAMEREGANGH